MLIFNSCNQDRNWIWPKLLAVTINVEFIKRNLSVFDKSTCQVRIPKTKLLYILCP
jgi:hypothetical protein